MPKRITTSERRHLDYLRRNGLKVGKVYMARLQRLRHAEASRVLELCRQMSDPATWPSVMETNISETYFPDWLSGLYSTAGMQHARSVERDLRRGKADLVDHPWESGLRSYATQRAGNEIVIVSGTMKTGLVKILRGLMESEAEMGIEKLTKRILKEFDLLQRWECRRIAQTETMVGMAEAGRLAADSLDVPFVKQWAVSGLANTRDTHLAMDGVTVDQDDYFELPDCRMLYPHDNSLNPPASEIINCACDVIRRPKSGSWTSEVSRAVKPVTTPIVDNSAVQEERIKRMIAEMPQSVPEGSRRAIAENNIALEKALNVQKGNPMSINEADKSNSNPNYSESESYHINCQTCSPAYLMRTRGFDITAGPNTGKKGNLSHYLSEDSHFWSKWLNADGSQAKYASVKEWMSDNGITEMSGETYLKFYEESTKEEGIYEVAVSWLFGGGHSTVLQRLADGTLMRIDAQVGSQETLKAKNWICQGAARKKEKLVGVEGVMRIDDKIFDTKYAKIFKKNKK